MTTPQDKPMTTATKKPPKKAKAAKAPKPKAEKPKKPAKPSKAERQQLETEKVSELIKQQRELNAATQEWNAAHAEAASAKKEMEKQQGILNGIVTDLTNIRTGNYTPGLPFQGTQDQPKKGNAPAAPPQVLGDDALLMPMSALIEFGMTVPKLESVASAAEGNTIGALEKFLRSDRDWMRKCKGLGAEWTAKLTDALAAFRRKHPMPETDVVLTASEKAAREAKVTKPRTDEQAAKDLTQVAETVADALMPASV